MILNEVDELKNVVFGSVVIVFLFVLIKLVFMFFCCG